MASYARRKLSCYDALRVGESERTAFATFGDLLSSEEHSLIIVESNAQSTVSLRVPERSLSDVGDGRRSRLLSFEKYEFG